MKIAIRHIFFLSFLVSYTISGTAQSGFYVPQNGKIFFSGDSATIFSNVLNQGKLGVGKNAVVNFQGGQWENDLHSQITDESNGGETSTGNGGLVRFVSADSVPQRLKGGYNAVTHDGPSFSSLQVKSKAGLQMSESSTRISKELQLAEGLVFVNDNILVVGNGNPGKITGYDSLHYIVTGSNNSDGFLYRESVTDKDGVVVFPVGSKPGAYTPVAVRSHSATPDNFYTRVSDGVRPDADRPQLNDESVNKTWVVGKQLRPNQEEVDVTLEHLRQDEGSQFVANRTNAYVAQYLSSQSWDEGYPQTTPTTGRLTSGRALQNSGDNSRSFLNTVTSASYFTVLTGKGDTSRKKTVLWFNGYRLDPNFARVYWRTNPEINNRYFIVQRRFSKDTSFTNIDTVLTKSLNGSSYTDLNYEIIDPNNYHGVTFYRLILVDGSNKQTYSNIIAVAGTQGKFKLTLWPNPTPDKFNIGLNGEVDVKTVVIWDAVGRLLREIPVNGRSIIEVRGLIPGTYAVGFISSQGEIIETKKVVVLGY